MTFAAYLTDGRTAERHAVRVFVDPRRLILLDAEERRVDEWPLEGLRLAQEIYRDQPVRLAHAARGEATLTVEEPAFLDALARVSPWWRRRGGRARITTRRLAAGVLALAVTVMGLIWLLPRLAGGAARWVPVSWEEAWGRQIAGELEARIPVCAGAPGRAALDALTVRLARATGGPYPFHVRVLDEGAVNAFALPGGQIALLRGLIAAAGGPDEVAGVLAHEMGHVLERHATEALLREAGLGLLVETLAGDLGGPSGLLADFGRGLARTTYSRAAEREADRVGAEILLRAGIGTEGTIAFLRRMAARQAGQAEAPGWLSDHPDPGERADAQVARPPDPPGAPVSPALEPAQWRALQSICE